jgi:superfamily II DNA or RNA helicase
MGYAFCCLWPRRDSQGGVSLSLSRCCSNHFEPRTRSRGYAYFYGDCVDIVESTEDGVCALVEGSRADPYQVAIDWSREDAFEVRAWCTCPHYEDGFLCKHIWATMLAVDQAGLARRLSEHGSYFVLHQDERDDEGWPGGSGFARPGRAHPMFGPGGPLPRGIPAWRKHLSAVRRGETDFEGAPSPFDSPSRIARRCEAWFVLNVGESLRRGKLIVDLFHRETGKSGQFGKIKRLRIRRTELEQIAEPQDRDLLQLLLGNDAQSDAGHMSQYYSGPYHDYTTYTRCAVWPAMYDLLLPRLSASGRFVWLLDVSQPVEEGRTIAWDDGPAWRFRMRIEPDDARQRWTVVGELYRDGQTAGLDEVVLLLAHGLVLFPDRVARLDAADEFDWISALRKNPTIQVPYADRDEFLDQLWSATQLPHIEFPDNLRVEQVRLEPLARLSVRSPEGYGRRGSLYGDITFDYDGLIVSWRDPQRAKFDAEGNRLIHRQPDRERGLLDQVDPAAAGWRPVSSSYRRLGDVEFPERNLPELVDRLTSLGWIVECEGRRVRRPGKFQLSVTSGIDWFELHGTVDFDGVTASLPSLLKALRHNEKYIRLDDGTQGMLPEEWLERYGGLVELGEQEDGSLKFAPSQAMLLDALLAAQEQVQVDRPFDNFRNKLRSFAGVDPCQQPKGFVGQLRGYQRDGLGWLNFLREFRFGGCLADDMGLGKTVQVLALLQSRRRRRLKKGESRRPSIVVVPKSLVFNWIDEAARFTPRLRVLDYTGLDRAARLEALDRHDLLVTTYGILRRDIVQLKEIHFDYAILDESQAIKNANAQAAKASRLLQADHRLAMTGTPVENHLGELWSLFEFLNPGMLGRSRVFNAIAKKGQGLAGDDSTLPMLGQALRPFLLRRTKEQVLTELPEKTEQTLSCQMAPKQQKLYDELRDYYRASLSKRVAEVGIKKAKIHVLEALLRLRQAACHPGLIDQKRCGEPSAKLDVLLDQIAEVVDEGHKALVFSQFTSLLAIVRERFDKLGIVYEYLDGQTRKRAARVKRFQEDPQCPLFLISLKAGGHGLNLTAADYVYILDPWWNPAVEAQAVDRTHRIGQTRRVFAYRLICHGTVEEKIVELQREKRDLADAIVSADNSLIRSLTADDLQLLLS